MTNPTIKTLTPNDIHHVMDIQLVAYGAGFLEPENLFENILTVSNNFSFLLQEDDKTLGYVFAYPSIDTRTDFDKGAMPITGDETTLYIHDLCLHPDTHGKGYAGQLFQTLEVAAITHGLDKIIGIAVQGSFPFWQKQGFTEVSKTTYKGEDGVNMAKSLN